MQKTLICEMDVQYKWPLINLMKWVYNIKWPLINLMKWVYNNLVLYFRLADVQNQIMNSVLQNCWNFKFELQ